jgi:hypothetical protein
VGNPGDELRFLADEMLGRLTRWLRLVGYDTAYASGADDAEVVRLAVEERRTLLTRDRRLAGEWRVPDCMVLRGDAPLDQLREVVTRFDLDWRAGLFSRCTVCNRLLQPAAPVEVSGRVPAGVVAEQRCFQHCLSCGRVYWHGSHAERMRRALELALGG